MKREIRDELAHIDQLVAADGNEETATVLSPDWLQQANRSVDARFPKPQAMKLADVDWSAYGQLRGLRATVRRVLSGADLDAALAETQAAFARSRRAIQGESCAERLKRYLNGQGSFSDAWFSDRREWATELLRRLDVDDPDLLRILADAGRTASEIKKELRNIMRSGSKSRLSRSRHRSCIAPNRAARIDLSRKSAGDVFRRIWRRWSSARKAWRESSFKANSLRRSISAHRFRFQPENWME